MNLFSTSAARAATIFLLCLAAVPLARAQDGFAGKATGGSGGTTVTARSPEEFTAHAKSPANLVILVEGSLRIGTVSVASNKTIRGASKFSTLTGNLFIGGGAGNVIIQNLNFTNPMSKKGKGGGDGITVRGGKLVWITQCTFFDCGDGCLDVTDGADWVTVSWCKFYFTKQPEHRFTMLAVGRMDRRKKDKAKNELHITLHHNWWAENCDQRMPSATNAELHMYNNYFNSPGNSYCSNARAGTELLSENNYYKEVKDPCFTEDGAKLKTVDNIYDNCTGKAERKNDKVFNPPYAYTLDKTKKVPDLVREGAGVR